MGGTGSIGKTGGETCVGVAALRIGGGDPDADTPARLQAAGDLREDPAEIGADGSHHHNCGNRNQCRDQSILNGRDAVLVFHQTAQGH